MDVDVPTRNPEADVMLRPRASGDDVSSDMKRDDRISDNDDVNSDDDVNGMKNDVKKEQRTATMWTATTA